MKQFAPPAEEPTGPRPVHIGPPAYVQTMANARNSVGQCRRLVVSALNVWGMAGLADDARLVVSEMATNVVQHCRSSTYTLCVTRMREGVVRIAVVDTSVAAPSEKFASLLDESGRGMKIISELATRVGVDQVSWGKQVWAELHLGPLAE